MKREILVRPFEAQDFEQRKDKKGNDIRPEALVTRLNEACEAWSFEIVQRRILDEEVLVVGKLTADGIVKMAFGAAAITRDEAGRAVSIGEDAKTAAGDCLKSAAALLGVRAGHAASGASRERPLTKLEPPARPPSAMVELPDPSDRLTTRQFSAVQAVARKKSLSSAGLRELLDSRFQKQELARLTRREASVLLSELTQANGKAP